MRIRKLINASLLLMAAVMFAACASEDSVQDKEKSTEKGTEAPKGGVIFSTGETKNNAKHRFAGNAEEFAKTRTSITHTPGSGADAYWTSDDYIWVKKQDGTWAKSTAITLHDGGTSAEFTLPGSKTDYTDGCEVRYTTAGNFLSHAPVNLVYFPQNQSRTIANDFSRAGEWGDCGSGVAHNTGNPDKFNFTLSHKSSYLCFLPRCTNVALAPNIRLKGIKVTANQATNNANFFPGFHSFNGDDIDYIGTPTIRRTIEITLPDFPLSTTTNQAANATYLVVPPDTYDFRIEYTIVDLSNNVKGTIKQTLTNVTLNKGEINDIIYDLTPREFSPKSFKYYAWDAQQDFWHGHEDEQPTINNGQPGATQGNAPQNNTDPRWKSEIYPGPGVRQDAQTAVFKKLPNVNELVWYLKKGDPHWGTSDEVYAKNGHLLRVEGLWLRKKNAIVNYLKANEGYPSSFTIDDLKEGYKASATAPLEDYRIGLFSQPFWPTQGAPANTADYFFLPVLGYYLPDGWLYSFGWACDYWSSSGYSISGDSAYALVIYSSTHLMIRPESRICALPILPFE